MKIKQLFIVLGLLTSCHNFTQHPPKSEETKQLDSELKSFMPVPPADIRSEMKSLADEAILLSGEEPIFSYEEPIEAKIINKSGVPISAIIRFGGYKKDSVDSLTDGQEHTFKVSQTRPAHCGDIFVREVLTNGALSKWQLARMWVCGSGTFTITRDNLGKFHAKDFGETETKTSIQTPLK